MTERQRATSLATGGRIAVAGVIIAGGAWLRPARPQRNRRCPTQRRRHRVRMRPPRLPASPWWSLRMDLWLRPHLHRSARQWCQRSRTPFMARVNRGRARSGASGIFGTRPRNPYALTGPPTRRP